MRLDGHAVPTGERIASHDAVRHARSLAARHPPHGATGPGWAERRAGVHSKATTPTRRPSGSCLDGPSRRQPEEVPMRAFIVELQNRPGGLAALAEAIAERGINITNVVGATCGGSGSLGIITNDEASTKTVLDGGSFSYRQIDLVTADLDDKPGTLGAAARRLADAGVNIELLLPTGMEGGKVSVAFGVDNAAAAQQALGELATVSR
ncbi:MAG: ACT domain-containing protein [Chloroflexi bacterium]|nr:MAG: ACT domain-containing protein [Chloroflexota bacterium]